MQFTKLRSGPTWPPLRAPATNSKSTTPTFSLYDLRLGGRWKPCWPHGARRAAVLAAARQRPSLQVQHEAQGVRVG
jgi:hypothetical protein